MEALAESAEPANYSLSEGSALWLLAQETLERVAGHFHPDKERPLLELTLPHTLLIIERASGELRKEIIHTLPFSHRLTLGNLVQARRLQETAVRYHQAYRLGRAVVSPASALYKEFSRAVGGQILDYGSERLQRWLGRRAGQPEPPLLVALTHSDRVDASRLQADTAARFSLAPERVLTLSLADPSAASAREPLEAALAAHHAQAVRSHYWRYLRQQRRAENRELASRQLRNAAGNVWRAARGVFRGKGKR